MTFDELKEKAHALPLKPGVYIMQNAQNEVIYVGKAKALKNRVSQYFANLASHTEKTRAMVSSIHHFDVIVADSEFEALVLECALIKRHQPKYNILLKDSKGYPYIRLTVKEEYPRFDLSNKVTEDGARYFGPYGSRGASNAIIDSLLDTFRLPTCHKKFPRDIGKGRPCLNFHMGKCDGYCRREMDQSRYRESTEQIVRLLEGKQGEVLKDLNAQMAQAAEELQFERAAALRDRVRAVELLSKRQKVVGRLADTDVVGFFRGQAKSCFVVLHFAEGELAAKDMDLIETPMEGEEEQVISALVSQYYGGREDLPRDILLPCELDDEVALTRMLSEAAGRRMSSSGGPSWSSSAWPAPTPWRRWSGPPAGRSGSPRHWRRWERYWGWRRPRTELSPLTSPTRARTPWWPPWSSLSTPGPRRRTTATSRSSLWRVLMTTTPWKRC